LDVKYEVSKSGNGHESTGNLLFVKSDAKESTPSKAPVELLVHEIKKGDIPKEARPGGDVDTVEAWFARTSIHENAAKDGTASWEEFDSGLRADHSQHEMDYTPGVRDAHRVLDWSSALAELQGKIGAWEDVGMYIVEMVHKIPSPLNDRAFPELVITAKKNEEFLVVQIPVDTNGLQNAKYNGQPKVQTAMYCSVEHGQVIEDGTKVKWRMATASDAKGILPMWAQKMGVPGAVVKDVGLFIDWCAKRRTAKS